MVGIRDRNLELTSLNDRPPSHESEIRLVNNDGQRWLIAREFPIRPTLQENSKDGRGDRRELVESSSSFLQVRGINRVIAAATKRRSTAFEKFKQACIDIGFSYSRLLAARVR